ncbi:uncharacterized protein LOC116348346 [Contarinia nasturtii]|uniref:uncharacterized protein LOC116348346 n=1 Tax=Contarinia nasturtii TaxID=265458 RepID=UPI0012D3B6A6|nr:uncharacterized protein LOC116348346 [Contarinia nasturtii]
MKFLILCIFVMVSICQAYPYYEPIEYDGFPVKEYDYGWPVYKSKGYYKSIGAELKDYWNTFKETFSIKYKELNAPYIVEKKVPVAVPVPVERIRTVFIKPRPKIIYRKITFFKPH